MSLTQSHAQNTTTYKAAAVVNGTVTTLAGSLMYGWMDGPDSTSLFHRPHGIALDSKRTGNMILVSDASSNSIRKITPFSGGGWVTATLAGSYNTGASDGQGISATFDTPRGVAVDSNGIVYVADWQNNLIRKVTPSGLVSTFAGSGSQGSVDGQGRAASFSRPFGVALDSSGNIFVSDSGNHRIRKITPSGLVSTFSGSGSFGFGDGQGTNASFAYPGGIAVDSDNYVYLYTFP